MSHRFAPPDPAAAPVWFVTPDSWPGIQAAIGPAAARFAAASGFEPKPGRLQLLPDAEGALAGALFGLAERAAKGRDPFAAGRLATFLDGIVIQLYNSLH